jgi:hypothetical protein
MDKIINTVIRHNYIELSDAEFAIIRERIIDECLTPFEEGNSLHVFHEVYLIDGKEYIWYIYVGNGESSMSERIAINQDKS